jgi:transposase
MRTSNVRTPIAGHNGTIFVALELSQRSWLVTMHSPDKDRFSRHKLDGGDDVGLLRLIERICLRAEQSLGGPMRVVSCYEAGYDGFLAASPAGCGRDYQLRVRPGEHCG